jgi:hypothetical protein
LPNWQVRLWQLIRYPISSLAFSIIFLLLAVSSIQSKPILYQEAIAYGAASESDWHEAPRWPGLPGSTISPDKNYPKPLSWTAVKGPVTKG